MTPATNPDTSSDASLLPLTGPSLPQNQQQPHPPVPTPELSQADKLALWNQHAAETLSPQARKQSTELFRERTRQQMSWLDTAGEAVGAVPQGLIDFDQAAVTPLFDAVSSSDRKSSYNSTAEYTTTGNISHVIAQQLPALVPLSRAMSLGRNAWAGSKLLGAALAGGRIGRVAQFVLETGLSGMIAFPGKQEKFADALAPHVEGTALAPVFDVLKTDPGGSETMNRFRNAVDGVLVGGPTELAGKAIWNVGKGVLRGVGILARKELSKEAGVGAEAIAKNLQSDIAQLRTDHPEIASRIDEIKAAHPDFNEEQAFTTVMSHLGKIGREGGQSAEDLAKLLTFVNGDNEAKAEVVDAALQSEARRTVDAEYEKYWAENGDRLMTEGQATQNAMDARGRSASSSLQARAGDLPPEHLPAGPNDRQVLSVETVEPTQGALPAPETPKALPAPGTTSWDHLETTKFLKENKPKVEPSLNDSADDLIAVDPPEGPILGTGPDALAQLWPVKGNVARATDGLDALGRQAFHMARVFAVEADDIPTARQMMYHLRAVGSTLEPKDATGKALKAKLASMTEKEAGDYLSRFESYYDTRKSVPVTAADVESVKPKAGVIDLNGETKTVQTYTVKGLQVHAESHPGGTYSLSVSVPDNRWVNDRVRAGWRSIDLQKTVKRADLKQAIADAATSSQRYYKTAEDGTRQGWTQVVDGRAVIGLFKTADVSTLVHELTHAYDLLGVAPEFFGNMRQALGFAVDDRSKAAAEAIARSFEHFAYTGALDQEWARPGWQKLSRFMSAVYKDVEKTPVGLEITEPVRMAFRQFGGLDAMGDHVGVRPEVEHLKSRLLDTDLDDPAARQAIFDKATDTFLNLGTVRGDDAKTVMAQLTDVFDHVIQGDRGGVETHKAAVADAVNLMLHNGSSLTTLSEMSRGADHLRAMSGKFLYWRGMTQSWADQVAKTLRAVRASPEDAGLKKQFEIAFDSFSRMRILMQDIQTESGRLLGKHKIVMPEVALDEELANVGYAALMQADDKSGGKLLKQFETLIERAKGDPARTAQAITDISRSVKDRTYMNLAKGLYLGSILSHPRVAMLTQVSGGLISSVTKPLQYVLGGVGNRDADSLRFGLDLYKNLFHTLHDFATLSAEGREGIDAIVRTFKSGASVSEHDAIPYLRPSDVRDLSGPLKAGIDGLYAVGTGALRTMNTLDEVYRQVYGRAFLRTRAMDEAAAKGLQHGTPAFEDFVHDFVKAGFDLNGAFLDPMTVRELQELTFKRPLSQSSSEAIKLFDRAMKLPLMWLFQPLLRTPVNIGREAVMSVPGVQYMSGAFREGISSSNPRIAAAYRGRQVMGLMTLGLFGMMAANGRITGSGPDRNSQKGRLWYDAGYQPYSFVVPNGDGTVRSIGYQQIEPFSTVAALCANAVEALDQSDLPDEKKTNVIAAVATGLSKVYSDKRYLMGLSAALKYANGDTSGANQTMAQIGSGVIPLSGAQSFVSDLFDDEDFKHAQGLVERIQNRTLFKHRLEPRRDFFGKPVEGVLWNNLSPLPVKTSTGDPVVKEMLSLGNRITNGFGEKLRGLDLTAYRNDQGQSAYDRRQELRQEVRLGDYTLHEALGRLIASNGYKGLAGDFDVLKEERADRIMKVVDQYNAAVQHRLLQEYPDLRTAFYAADPQTHRVKALKGIAAVANIPK
ncbi:MAG: hypothetical protein QM754_18195 [Tepidisphaeraceae bacterium]